MQINEKTIKLLSTIGPRASFGMKALDLIKKYKDLMIVTCDVSTSAGLDRFRKTYSDNYVDLGIAEQNMIGVATGLARKDYKVITTTFAPFQSMRCCEQIKVNLGYMEESITMVGLASGLVLGNLGYTHCCIEDIGVLRSIPNLTILYKPDKKSVGHFDYHCNLLKVYYYLNYKTYENIPTSLYLKDICVNTHQKHEQIINKLQISGNKSYMFNWHGNSNNLHEKYNRKMALENAIPLFKQKNINWIITTMDITNDEYDILREHENIYILKNEIENYDDTRAFCDTIEIFKYVEGVISTDTSLVHLSATMGIPTYILLTMGSHWFWCRNCDKTNWYPNATLIRQKKFHNWGNVINELCNILTD